MNVTQFADPFAEYRLSDDPEFKRWADKKGQSVYLKYLITHPWQTVSQPVIHAPQLMTMNPDYIATPALPAWASTLVYGNLSSIAEPNTPSGAPRSSDPIYVVILISVAAVLVVLAAVRRRLTRVIWVAVSALVFIVIWVLAVWNFAATELPREFIEPAVLFHLTAVVLIAAALDSLVSPSSRISKEMKVGGRRVADGPMAPRSSATS